MSGSPLQVQTHGKVRKIKLPTPAAMPYQFAVEIN